MGKRFGDNYWVFGWILALVFTQKPDGSQLSMKPKHKFGLKGPLSEPTTEKASKTNMKTHT